MVVDEAYLLEIIKRKKEELLSIAFQHGMNNEKTIHCSQELDWYIFIYQKIILNEQIT